MACHCEFTQTAHYRVWWHELEWAIFLLALYPIGERWVIWSTTGIDQILASSNERIICITPIAKQWAETLWFSWFALICQYQSWQYEYIYRKCIEIWGVHLFSFSMEELSKARTIQDNEKQIISNIKPISNFLIGSSTGSSCIVTNSFNHDWFSDSTCFPLQS